MTIQRPFPKCIGYLVTCVLPADLLSNDSDTDDPSSLRAAASQDNLTWVNVKYQIEDDLYVARVASSPALVANGSGYTVILSEEALFFAMVWDARLEWEDHLHTRKRRPEAILSLLRAHAAEVRPLTREAALSPIPIPVHAAALTPLETVEVSTQEVRAAFRQVTRDEKPATVQEHHNTQYFMQQALFQAMIDRLMDQLYQTQEQALALLLKARCGLLVQLQRWHRATRSRRIIHVARHFSEERHEMMWRLTAGLPDLAVA